MKEQELEENDNEKRDVASSQKLAVGAKGFEVTLRRFLADISPGLFLLLLVYLYDRGNPSPILDLSGEGSIPRMAFYFLIAIAAGFMINSVGYFLFFGMIVRVLEGWMLQCPFICGRLVTICDWEEVESFFQLKSATSINDFLLFRYNSESVMARWEPRWYASFEHVGGMEMLSRNVAVLAILCAIFVCLRGPLTAETVMVALLALIVALGFLLLSACDSLYVGIRCIRYLLVICKYQLRKEAVPWNEVLTLFYARSTNANAGVKAER